MWTESGGSESEMESLQTLYLSGLCFRLCAEEAAQKADSAFLNIDYFGAS